jgi:hypothetical protein
MVGGEVLGGTPRRPALCACVRRGEGAVGRERRTGKLREVSKNWEEALGFRAAGRQGARRGCSGVMAGGGSVGGGKQRAPWLGTGAP